MIKNNKLNKKYLKNNLILNLDFVMKSNFMKYKKNSKNSEKMPMKA